MWNSKKSKLHAINHYINVATNASYNRMSKQQMDKKEELKTTQNNLRLKKDKKI